MVRSRLAVSRLAFAAALTCVPIAGCYYYESPPPPPPPAPRQSLVISGQYKQTKAQQDRDSAQCQSQASAQASSSQGWVEIFTACMSGRGYLVQ